MATTETRLLVLGTVRVFEPVNAYQIRRELMSWRADAWAHLNPGSIYSALATLTKAEHVVRHDLVDNGREVAVYTTTASGREEFDRLFTRAMTDVDPSSMLGVYTALAVCTQVPREQFLDLLRERRRRLERATQHTREEYAEVDPGSLSPHVAIIQRLWGTMGAEEVRWIDDTIEAVSGGASVFAGEQSAWQPPDDELNRQHSADRRRYREMLGL